MRDLVASLSLSLSLSRRCSRILFFSSLSLGGDSRRMAVGVAAVTKRWRSGGAEGTGRYGFVRHCLGYRAYAHLLSGREDNGRGILIGAARRLLLPRLPSRCAARRAISRDTCRRARFKSRYAVYVTDGTLYVCARYSAYTLYYFACLFIIS